MKKSQILEAIQDSGGIINKIAHSLDVDWHTARKYIYKWEETKKAFEAEQEKLIDKAESVVVKQIDNDDIQTAKWYLSTKGKHRGYSEKQELEHSGSLKTSIVVDKEIDE